MATSSVLPVIIRGQYDSGSGFAEMVQEAQRASGQIKRSFDASFAEIGRVAQQAVGKGLTSGGAVNVDVSAFREAAAQATAYRTTVEELSRSATALAKRTGDTSAATRAYLQALQAQSSEARAADQAAQAQLTTYSRLQAELDASAKAVDRVSESYRALVLAQNAGNIAAANAEVGNRRFTEFQGTWDKGAITTGTSQSARESAAAFEAMFAAEMKAAAGATELAAATARFKAQIDPAVAAQQRYTEIIREADRLYKSGAIGLREFAAAHRFAQTAMQGSTAAARQGTTAHGNVINSLRSERTAFIQLGQQMQDVMVQAQMGTSAFTIFAQQVPQAAFALTGLASSANTTKAAIGRFATFMSGPWGAAIFIATAALGPLVYRLFDTGDAAKDAEKKTYDFSEGLNVLELSANETANAMKQLADEMRSAIIVQGNFLRQKALIAGSAVTDIQGRISQRQTRIQELEATDLGIPTLGGLLGTNPLRKELARLKAEQSADRKALASALGGAADSEIAVSQTRALENIDAATAATGRYDRAVGALLERRRKTVSDPVGASASGLFIDEKGFEAEFARLTKLKNAEVEAAQAANRKKRGSGKSEDRAAEAAARSAFQLSEFAADADDRIGRMRQSFEDTPPAIARMKDGLATLDDLSSDIEEKMRRGLDPKLAAALQAKIAELRPIIEDSVNQPFSDMVKLADEARQIDELLIAGKQDEAEVLSRIFDLTRQKGDLTAAQVAYIRDIVAGERARSRELEKQNELRQREVRLIEGTRDNLRDTMQSLARGGGVGAIGKLFERQFDLALENTVDNLFEQVFGDFFRDEKDKALGFDKVREASDRQVETINETVSALNELRDAVRGAATQYDTVAGERIPIPTLGADNDNYDPNAEIVVTGGKVGAAKKPATGGDFVSRTTTLVARLFMGADDAKKIGDAFSKGLKSDGAAYGALAGGLIVGQGGSPLGATIGGALGEKLGEKVFKKGFEDLAKGLGDFAGPLGSILGGVAGSLIGSLMTSAPRASSTIGGVNGSLAVVSTRGNSAQFRKASEGSAGEAIDTLDRIAEALGATIDASMGSVSIGVRKGKYRVDPSGSGITKTSRGAIDFGEDSAAAIRAATMDLIKDGVLQGLRDSTRRLLQGADDLDKAIKDALDFEGVFTRLKEIKDPVGAALDALNKDFERLIGLFQRAGASTEEFAALEELYGLERAKAIKDASEAMTGPLKDLIADLETGDNGLSLRARRENALSKFNPLADAIRAGQTVDYNEFTDAARTLLEISRELFGSQDEYFATFNDILNLSKTALAGQENVVSIADGSPSPFISVDTVPVVQAVDAQSQMLLQQLSSLNVNSADILAAIQALGNLGGQQANGTYF